MNWEDGKLFLAVAREGKMLTAARKLGLNQATLSRRLSAFEAELQATLLVRGPSGCVLTDDGEALVIKLERAESAMLEGQALFNSTDTRPSGVVRIGAPDGFGVSYLTPRLSPLLDRYPDLRIELVAIPRSFSLSQREADLAIMVGRPEKGRLIARKLTSYSLGLYASKRYLEHHGVPPSEPPFTGHRVIGYVEDLLFSPSLDYASDYFGGTRAQLGISSAIAQMEAVKAGAGIGVLHDYLAVHEPELVRLASPVETRREYWLAYHESQKELRRLKVVSDYITGLVTSDKGWIVDA
ncbi:LysR family transcriptional regulator [Celeribacter marinus]|uniref:LysR family transcriptional regulator n=1 Tax=Celeribacter marinus TaxID=1397108 RepID=UPI00321D8359